MGTVRRQPVDMIAVVQQALRRLDPSLRDGIAVHAELETFGTRTLGDCVQLQQLVVELCTHALKAMPRGGRMTLRLEGVEVSEEFARTRPPLRAGHQVRLTVEDTGQDPGIGPGSPLAVVNQIALAHQGALVVTSELGNGSTFEVFLPAKRAAPKPLVEPIARGEQPGHGERLMLVDDQPNVARASAMLFEQLGYQVTVFTDPREALAAFRRSPQQFDVVMTDLSMPQLSGMELATALHAVRTELPVIVTTGHDMPEDVRQSLGVHAVLQKPWRVEDAITALRRVLAG